MIDQITSSYNAVIGSSGTGKTTSYIIPEIKNAIKDNKSFLVTDAKNEVMGYLGNMLKERGYKIVRFNLRDLSNSISWNPLSLPLSEYRENNLDNCYYLLNCIGEIIFNQGTETNNDPFWDISSRDLFIGLAFALFEDAKTDEQINLCSIYSMAMSIFDSLGPSNYLKEYIYLKQTKQSYAVACTYGTIMSPSDTRSSIMSVFQQKMRMLTMNERYNSILCTNGENLSDLLRQKTAFIVQYEDEFKESIYLSIIFINQILTLLANERAKGDKKCKEFCVFFEDFLLLKYYPNIMQMILSYKARNISMYFSVNSLSLMKKIYGEEITSALLDNCDNIIFTGHKNKESIDYINMYCGDDWLKNDITPNQSIVIHNHNQIEVINKHYAEAVKSTPTTFSVNPSKRQAIQVFSIKEIVDRERDLKINEMLRRTHANSLINDPQDDPLKDVMDAINKKIEEIEASESKNKESSNEST